MMAGELEKAELVQQVAEQVMQGKKIAQIARERNISVQTVKTYYNEWETWIKAKASSDPEMLDKFLENSLKFIETFDLMIQNAWDVHEEAKDAGAVGTRLQALKLAQELTEKKARLYQLLGPRMDTSYIEKAKRAERVNEILSDILRTTVGECDVCKPAVWNRLQEAFSMMDKDIPVEEIEQEPFELEAHNH